ncbi:MULTISPECIES: substrate-binding domain-containing protein [Rhizobium]|uniref:substrate-binding domain-containing protein n=1 Tax=Rhizobium TaxID=379 RepID=UPI0007EB326D|nr:MULTISPECIES: substrate-binding domain-containing protein [Rhizobium]ANK92212.1 rhizopine ABC transporter substrate-binding protein [Rhizobium sp. N6212]ANK98252.1 rhizopine ABC transporter substrate-binding protein [Rhizobium sp. N621]ANL04332.1 rhizopine ABC transporter substrate-binding protein [Rhizobium esperanzae]ANL10444.1 rhizopine ABC transporter substrate-binding protein [Rhizobium sp. N1341]ANL22497.1 rhizopine ABC transporter substrate-binding protein [Rhizobium sp. N113]
MKSICVAAVLAALTTTAASAETIGVSMQSFDNNFQTLLREGLQARASKLNGVSLQIEDAQTDVSKQRSQVDNFIASGVDAIIMTLTDTSAATGISEAARKAGIPLVYLNLEPENIDRLPEKQAYVGSKETDSGRLGAEAACDLLKKEGKANDAQAYILMGDLAHQASRDRTSSVKATLSAGDCKGVTIADEQTAAWTRTNAMDLTTNWLTAGRPIDVIFANNDEMALGAIQALKASGVSMDDVIVVGIDATQDALAAMAAGDLDVTVFQNAKQQAASAVDAAVALAHGNAVDKEVWVPFELVTPKNMAEYAKKN